MRIIGLVFLLISQWALADNQPATVTQVIQLQYQQASDIMPQLNAVLKPGERISGKGSTLIVNASEDTLTQLKPVIRALDTPPVVFVVSIHQGDADWLAQQNDSATVYTATSRNESGNAQSVSVISGQTAFVSMGQEQPIISAVSGGWYPGVGFDRKRTEQGFFITPILQGQQVNVKIQRIRGQMSQVNQENSADQRLETSTMVPLNQWVALGSTGQSDTNSQPDATTYTAQGSFANETSVYIKISIGQ